MSKTKFIYGFRKSIIDIRFIIRLYFKAFHTFGFSKAFKEIKKYFKDERCLFRNSPNRYIKSGKEIIAVPDLPPVNSKKFINHVISDIQWVNNNKRPNLVFAIFCITSRCPFKCKYCYNSDLHINEERLSLESIFSTIDGLIEQGVTSIYLSGGEPLMRWDDLLEILNKYQNSDIRFWLLSTGYNLSAKKLNTLKHIGLKGVMISLDSFDENHINETKGSSKAFEYATTAIMEANKIGLFVALDCVFGRTLLEQKKFDKFINLAGKLGAHFINCYSPRQMHHELNHEYSNFGISEFTKLEKLTTENHLLKDKIKAPITYAPDLWEAKRACVGGKLFIYISPDGNVRFCPFVDKSFGNITEDKIGSIIDKINSKKLDHICSTNKLLSNSI